MHGTSPIPLSKHANGIDTRTAIADGGVVIAVPVDTNNLKARKIAVSSTAAVGVRWQESAGSPDTFATSFVIPAGAVVVLVVEGTHLSLRPLAGATPTVSVAAIDQ